MKSTKDINLARKVFCRSPINTKTAEFLHTDFKTQKKLLTIVFVCHETSLLILGEKIGDISVKLYRNWRDTEA